MHGPLATLGRRKIVRWTLAYLAAAWLLAQVLDLVGQQFGWPTGVQRGITVFLGCGALVAMVVAWFHGERGAQRVPMIEVVLVAALLVAAAGLSRWAVQSAAQGPSHDAPPPATLPAGAPPESPARDDGRTLAVLPFENRSATGEDAEFLAAGIHEDLIGSLSRVPGLKVISRLSVLRYQDSRTDPQQIAAALSAGVLLGGSVQRAGDRVRVSVQLVRPSDQSTLWAEHYDRLLSADSVLTLQGEITAAISRALALQLDPAAELARSRGMTGDTAAYEAFLRGRQAWNSDSLRGDRDSIVLFQKAIEIDPKFATAYGTLAEAYVSLGNDSVEAPGTAFPLAQAAAQRALAIDERVVQAHTALGEIAFHHDWNWAASDRHLRRAIELDPNYVIAYTRLATHLAAVGRFDEAIAAAREAWALDPLARNVGMSSVLLMAGRYPESLAAARHATDLLAPASATGIDLALALYFNGQPDEAIRILETSTEAYPDNDGIAASLGWLYGRVGRTDDAMAVYRRLESAAKSRLVSPLRLAEIAAGAGDADLALTDLQRAYAARDPMLPTIGTAVAFEPVRGHPEFVELLGRLGPEFSGGAATGT